MDTSLDPTEFSLSLKDVIKNEVSESINKKASALLPILRDTKNGLLFWRELIYSLTEPELIFLDSSLKGKKSSSKTQLNIMKSKLLEKYLSKWLHPIPKFYTKLIYPKITVLYDIDQYFDMIKKYNNLKIKKYPIICCFKLKSTNPPGPSEPLPGPSEPSPGPSEPLPGPSTGPDIKSKRVDEVKEFKVLDSKDKIGNVPPFLKNFINYNRIGVSNTWSGFLTRLFQDCISSNIYEEIHIDPKKEIYSKESINKVSHILNIEIIPCQAVSLFEDDKPILFPMVLKPIKYEYVTFVIYNNQKFFESLCNPTKKCIVTSLSGSILNELKSLYKLYNNYVKI